MNESNSTAIIKDDDGFNKGSPSWDKATMTIDRNFNQLSGIQKVGYDNLVFEFCLFIDRPYQNKEKQEY